MEPQITDTSFVIAYLYFESYCEARYPTLDEAIENFYEQVSYRVSRRRVEVTDVAQLL